MKSLFIKLSLLFLFVFNLNLFASDQCSSADYSSSLSTTNPSYTQTDSVYWTIDWRGRERWDSQTYYINVLEPGSVKVTLTNAIGGNAKFTYSETSCPDYTGVYETVKTYTFSSPVDFNVYVDATNLQSSINYTIKFEFTPAITTTPPVATNDTASTTRLLPVTISVLSNDSDHDGDAAIDVSTVVVASQASNGTAVANSDGTITYTPDSPFDPVNLGDDTFTYTVKDVNGATSTAATVTVTVSAGSNQNPLANDKAYAVTLGSSVSGNVITDNIADSDPDGDALKLNSSSSYTTPSKGTLTVISNGGNGDFTYTPNSGASGTDTFNYTISDGYGGTATATITITIQADIQTCPGYVIPNLEGTTVSATDSDSGTILGNSTYYYHFTPLVDGTLQVDSSVSASYNSLFIKDGCGSTLWEDTDNTENKSSPSIDVLAGQQIVIALERRYDSSKTYSIDFTYTYVGPRPPIMGDVPNQIATINTAYSLNISSYVTMTNGDSILTYNLTGTLPSGLSFNSSTGLISGTPTVITASSTFSVTATDQDGVSNSDSFTLEVTELNVVSTGGRNFALRHQENLFGDVLVIGNTVLCQKDASGACEESGSNVANNNVNLQKAPESSAVLVLPTDATVEYARLYWLGRTDDGWNATTQASAGQIEIKKGSAGTYTPLTANIKDAIVYDNSIYLYSASADASSIVDGPGTYYIDASSFYTVTGTTSDGLGTSGSWALVVVYSDPNETTAKNLTIFDGYKKVTSNTDASASVTGFLTPKSGLVDSMIYVMAAEGDKYLNDTSDRIQMAGATYSTTLQNLGTFDSRIDLTATRTPSLTNNNGTDIHTYNVGTGNGGAGIINTNEVGANFNFTSNVDVYFPSLFVFSTELYLPQLCYDYSIKQDGRYLSIDRATYPKAQIDGYISSSDLEVEVYLRNQEADIPAEGIAIRTDVNTTQFNHLGNIYTSNINGSSLIDRGTPSAVSPLCDYDKDGDNSYTNNGCTDGHNIRKGNGTLAAQNYIYTKFKLQPQNISGIADINESLGLSIKYYITADGNKVEYPDYVLGGQNVPLCPPTGIYQPAWGQFNVVQSGQTAGSIVNNIYTQVSRKPFNADVVFDSTPLTGNIEAPTSDINTTVLVEMIDLDAFGDINASCANPDASISTPIILPLNFTTSNYQATIPTQTSDYYNFAVKNATFRIWYFDDGNQTLIQNWTATTTNSSKTVTSISGLYNSTVHTACSASCSTSTSTACFECIKTNYARPICSRDNFSVRPESYSLNVFDINQSLPVYDIDTDPSNLKNTTKVNLSTLTNYAPGTTAPTDRMHLAAGYKYRFDINSTGNDGMELTPGYTRHSSEYNASMLWNPQSVKSDCNDTTDHSYSFYFKNGKVENQERSETNVGEYRFNITDTTWTAVDWQSMSHHTTANAFATGDDCIVNSSLTSGVQNGCTITTNHGNDSVGNTYIDHDITIHPYKFNLDEIVASVGTDHQLLTPNSFVYMSDISKINTLDENMSLHLNGKIKAVGYDNVAVSNFVGGCYAVPLDLNLSKSDTVLLDTNGNNVTYKSRFHKVENNGSIITSNDINTSEVNSSLPLRVQIPASYFIKDSNGSMNTINNINYNRDVNVSANPKLVTLNSYDVNCTNSLTECTFNADLLNNKTTNGQVSLDQNITYYYGRTNAPRQVFVAPIGTAGNPAIDFIYYEVFCSGAGCDKSQLPNGLDANSTDDPRWFINTNHTSGFGDAGSVNQKGFAVGSGAVTGSVTSGNHQDSTSLVYNASKGYPYKTTMENNASNWLIYNKYDGNDTNNEFQVEFINAAGSWAGTHETNTTTNSNAAPKTNRRTMW
jgi:hypothetical protein